MHPELNFDVPASLRQTLGHGQRWLDRTRLVMLMAGAVIRTTANRLKTDDG